MEAPHVLVLLFGMVQNFQSGAPVQVYPTYEACDQAGKMATKLRTIEYVCIPAPKGKAR